ncbi:MAG: hypothetical protein ABJM43_18910 [Paracoccaceae bacterium]
MIEIVALVTVYYQCTALAEEGLLTQSERFACNSTYQQIKREFVQDIVDPTDYVLKSEQNVLAFQRFKTWEAENADLVRELKRR